MSTREIWHAVVINASPSDLYMVWAIYLLSLKEFVEKGKGRLYPYDMPVR
jgi:hypothetical protein